MTPDEYAEGLGEVSAMVLEEAAFVFTEPSQETPSWEGEVVETRLEFTGDGNGSVMMAAPKSLCLELAANLLGIEPGEETSVERPAEAALSEMLNMIAGPLTAKWFGDQAVCNIGVPAAKTVPAPAHETWSNAATCSITLVAEEDDPIELAAIVE